MNEIDKAIRVIGNALNDDADLIYSGEEFYYIIKQALQTALEALKEKQERDKGCPCCNGFHPDKVGEKIYVWSVYYVDVGDGAHNYIHAKYCPLCGRKLEVDK